MMLFNPVLIGLEVQFLTECALLLTVLCDLKSFSANIDITRFRHNSDDMYMYSSQLYITYIFQNSACKQVSKFMFSLLEKGIKIIIMLRFK